MVQVFAVCPMLLALVSGFQSTKLVESAAEPIGEKHPSDWLFSLSESAHNERNGKISLLLCP